MPIDEEPLHGGCQLPQQRSRLVSSQQQARAARACPVRSVVVLFALMSHRQHDHQLRSGDVVLSNVESAKAGPRRSTCAIFTTCRRASPAR